MGTPLVSVMMPCFNAALTLPLAIASLKAQTLTDWECVCVDDGSSDETFQVLERHAAVDSRIRVERFPVNRGRGAARQRVLDRATGEFLAFLDSDDWMYPERLAHEAGWLQREPAVAAVSVCAAITDGPEQLVGVQRPPGVALPLVERFDEPHPPLLMFPPSMIRTQLAKHTGFDPTFKRSQDSDFLIRALLGRSYGLSDQILYAYSQGSAASLERTLEGYRFRIRAHLRYWRSYPVRVSRTVAETVAKMAAYKVAGVLGREQQLIQRRWGAATDNEADQFMKALGQVRACLVA